MHASLVVVSYFLAAVSQSLAGKMLMFTHSFYIANMVITIVFIYKLSLNIARGDGYIVVTTGIREYIEPTFANVLETLYIHQYWWLTLLVSAGLGPISSQHQVTHPGSFNQ